MKLLICLVLMTLATPEAPKKPVAAAEISIKRLQYQPAQVKVKVGEIVRWTNNDDRDHTVDANDGMFSSGKISTGESFDFKFLKKGKFSYGCDYHPRMKGIVIVE
jgi:plastocyanin